MLILRCCCDKLTQTLWLKPTQIYLTALEVRGQNESHGVKIKMSVGLLPLRVQRRICLLTPFNLQRRLHFSTGRTTLPSHPLGELNCLPFPERRVVPCVLHCLVLFLLHTASPFPSPPASWYISSLRSGLSVPQLCCLCR